jgi:hypothetical protein
MNLTIKNTDVDVLNLRKSNYEKIYSTVIQGHKLIKLFKQ